MAVKKGFKQSEVGEIPEDWSIKTLGRLVLSIEYGSSAKSAIDGLVPVLRMGNLQDGKIDWSNLVYTSNSKEIAKYSLKAGDVLFNRTNTIDLVGKTSLYDGSRPAIFAGYLIRITVNSDYLDPRYLNLVLNTENARKHSSKVLSVAVGQANINGQKLKTYPIPLPPTLAEQEAIAGALSDADAWIESLEHLIAKKRLIKQGAMQELLTGKRRLPGFSGKWRVKRLSECLQVSPGYGINAPGVKFDSRLPTYLRITDITDDGVVDANNRVSVSHPDSQNYVLEKNDIVFARTGASVGKTYLYRAEDGPMVFAGFLIRVKVNPLLLDPFFLFAITRTRKYWNWVRTMSMRSGQPGINGAEYASLEIDVPPSIEEQSAISKVLLDQQLAIAEVESELVKARQIKQAMMQELLTGRIRLVEPTRSTVAMPEAAHA